MKNEENNTRTIEELQDEVARLENEDTLTTKRVTKQLRLEGISKFDAETVYDELNLQASIMENIAHALMKKHADNVRGLAYQDCADMVRKAMTSIIRLERYRQRVANNLKEY